MKRKLRFFIHNKDLLAKWACFQDLCLIKTHTIPHKVFLVYIHTNTHLMHTRAGAPVKVSVSRCHTGVPQTQTYHGARSQDGNESGSLFHVQWNKDTLGSHWSALFHCQQCKKILVGILEKKWMWLYVCINCVHILYVRVPDSVSYNTELCTRLAGGNGLVSATPGGFHQTLPNLIHLANQEGFWGVTMVTIQIYLSQIGSGQGRERLLRLITFVVPSLSLWVSVKTSTHSDIDVEDVSILKWPTAGHRNIKKWIVYTEDPLHFLIMYNFCLKIQLKLSLW